MEDLKYSDILRLNNELGKTLDEKPFKVAVLSNIITAQLNQVLEYVIRTESIGAEVVSGDYDNILQDSQKFKEAKLVIVFWELSNLIDGLHYKANLMSNKEIDELILKVKSEIDFVFLNLEDASLILFNKFSTLVFNHQNIVANNFDRICNELNAHIEEKRNNNVVFIEIDKVIARASVSKSVDFRYYYSSKALYTIEFYKNYSRFIKPIVLSSQGRSKKALLLDCDNTLWKGVLGEDGFDNIEMSGHSRGGVVFEEVQSMVVDLYKKGVLIALCSKNNEADIDEVLEKHPDITLKDEHVLIKKVNWKDKARNISEIAKELNIGKDSFVFIDDSDFETGILSEIYPEIYVHQVPKNLYEYPQTMREIKLLFHNNSSTKEDLGRTEMYRQQVSRAKAEKSFSDIEGYLKSLDLTLSISLDDLSSIARISQLTQKTNQFNLTTIRYTEKEIESLMLLSDSSILSFSVSDKFGDHGLTGICILKFTRDKKALIDTFLMSCRVIGRNIEFAFFDFVVIFLSKKGIELIDSAYLKTLKNKQVSDLYDKLGFELSLEKEGNKEYKLKLENYTSKGLNYITLNYEGND